MSDDITLPGTGVVVKTEEVGGRQYQVVKLATGTGMGTAAASPNYPVPVGGLRKDSDGAVFPDGEQAPFLFNSAGRLKVSAQPADIETVTGTFTGPGQTIFIDCSRASNIVITSAVTVTATGHNAVFEYSNDSTNGADGNWKGLQVVRSNANTVDTSTGVLTTTPAYGWEASVNGCKWFRVRTTAQTAGSVTYTLSPGAYATEPIPAIQVTGTQPVSGSVTATPATPTAHNLNSAATTNATVIKGSAGTLYNIGASNTGAAVAFIKLYNKATAPTVGTDVPVLVLAVPANGNVDFDLGPLGHRFTTGIGMAITNLAADSDTTAVAASQVKVLTSFI